MRVLLLFMLWGWGTGVVAEVSTRAHAQPLVVAITDNFAMPYILQGGNKVAAQGIVYEMLDELGQRLHLDVHYIVLPRQRLRPALKSGLAHLLPLANPKWYTDEPDLQWSPVWLEDEDRFVIHTKDRTRLQSIEDMHGKQVGTILGYRYPELEGWVVRQDARSLRQNLERLAHQRLDAVIDSAILIRYRLKYDRGFEQLLLTPIVAGHSARHLGLSRLAPVSIEELSQALQSMLDDGTVAEIVARYQ